MNYNKIYKDCKVGFKMLGTSSFFPFNFFQLKVKN